MSGLGRDFKKEIRGLNWNQENFLGCFFWTIQWPRNANIIACFSDFLGGGKGLNQKCNQSVGIKLCCIFISVNF